MKCGLGFGVWSFCFLLGFAFGGGCASISFWLKMVSAAPFKAGFLVDSYIPGFALWVIFYF